MNLMRIFANAIVRRVAYVFVALVLAWMGLGKAQAKTCSGNLCMYPDQGAAYAGCMADAAAADGMNPGNGMSYANPRCPFFAPVNRYRCEIDRLNSNGSVNTTLGCSSVSSALYEHHEFVPAQTCASRPDTVGTGPWNSLVGQVRSGSVGCATGCTTAYFRNGDGTVTGKTTGEICAPPTFPDSCAAMGGGYYWNPWLAVCEPQQQECTANQVKNSATGECEEGCPAGMKINDQGQCEPEESECPAGQVKSPDGSCLPGEGQCAAGEARRKDGTCGKDSDGDGEADDDDDDPNNDSEKETFSGGDNCNNPPSCSGSPVMCGQARIQWRIDCNTRKNRNVSGGSCGAMPICTGEKCDAVEYSQLLMQWRTACALEKMGQGGPGGGDNGDLIDLITGPGTIQPDLGGTGDMPGGDGPPWGDGEEVDPDDSGFGYGSTCPQPPSFSIGGQTISIDMSVFCDWVSLGGSIVLIMASLACVRIVAGSAT